MHHQIFVIMKRYLLAAILGAGLQTNAQVSEINENFNSFTTGTTSIPQNGWSKVTTGPFVYVDGANGENYVQNYSFLFPNVASYVVSPQIVAPNGSTKISFTAAQTTGSAGAGTIEVGLASSTTDMSGFVSLGAAIPLTSTTKNTYTFNVPASSNQYIVFKFVGSVAHAALLVDNVVYGQNLAVSEINKNDLRFAINDTNTSLVFVSQKYNISSVEIYSSNGQKVAEGNVINNTFDIAKLLTGAYFLNIKDTNGKTLKSKFLKK